MQHPSLGDELTSADPSFEGSLRGWSRSPSLREAASSKMLPAKLPFL